MPDVMTDHEIMEMRFKGHDPQHREKTTTERIDTARREGAIIVAALFILCGILDYNMAPVGMGVCAVIAAAFIPTY